MNGKEQGVRHAISVLHPVSNSSPVDDEVALFETIFNKQTKLLGTVECEASALIAKEQEAKDGVHEKLSPGARSPGARSPGARSGATTIHGVRMRVLQRVAAKTEDSQVDTKLWKYRTWEKLGLRLLMLSDKGHGKGDNIWKVFKLFDTGGAGTIDPKEFMHGLASFKIHPTTKTQGQELFELCDLQRYGEIHYTDFQKWVRGMRGVMSITSAVEFDKDREFSLLWSTYCSDLSSRVVETRTERRQRLRPKTKSDCSTKDQHGEGYLGSPLRREHHHKGQEQQDTTIDADLFLNTKKPESPEQTTTHSSSQRVKGRSGLPYFWLSDRPGSTRKNFKPSPEKLPIANASPANILSTSQRNGWAPWGSGRTAKTAPSQQQVATPQWMIGRQSKSASLNLASSVQDPVGLNSPMHSARGLSFMGARTHRGRLEHAAASSPQAWLRHNSILSRQNGFSFDSAFAQGRRQSRVELNQVSTLLNYHCPCMNVGLSMALAHVPDPCCEHENVYSSI